MSQKIMPTLTDSAQVTAVTQPSSRPLIAVCLLLLLLSLLLLPQLWLLLQVLAQQQMQA
jgi:hypothetical protein